VTGYPLLYLTLCSIRNRLRVRLRRLREPKYLIGSILGVAYFSFIVMGRGGRNGPRGPMRAIVSGRSIVELGATMLMFVAAAVAWIWPRSKPALPFSRAEVQHLFTAPISRRDLVRYRVLRSQVGALAASAIMTFVAGPASVMEAVRVFVGLMVLMVTSNMHLTAVSLSRASQGARRWLPRAVAAGAVVVVGATLATNWADLTAAAARGEDFAAEVIRLSDSGAAGIVLWPFRAIARLPVAGSTGAFLAALPWALVLLALNYVWVLRTKAPFEEASAELSEKLDQLRQRGPAAFRQPRASKRTPFTLAPHGRPETAILWKNLISMGRILSWTTLIRVAPLLVLLALALSGGRNSTANVLAGAGVLVAGFTLLLGPQLARNDLRQDLAALAVLKTWPLRAAALVRGEILAPAIVLTTVIFLALIVATALSVQVTFPAAAGNRWSWLLAALLVAPGLVLAQLLAQNGLAVTFPSWVSIGNRTGGVDVVGQQLLLMLAVILALVAAVLPAAIVAVIGVGIFYLLTGVVSVILAGVLAGGALLVEAFIASEVLGAILERSDISAIDAPES
jgi:hypothetical protein